jgi:hypothetical protein
MGSNLRDGNVGRMGMVMVSIDVASVAANVAPEQTFTVLGLRVGDFVVVNPVGAITTNLVAAQARVSADDTLAIVFVNTTAGALDPAAQSYRILWFRPEVANPAVLPSAVQV